MSYRGNVDVTSTWETLKNKKDSVLVDVRSRAEWTFVGVPDLSSLNKETICIEWQVFPAMGVNPEFVAHTERAIKACGGSPDSDVFFLCRSGMRSMAAAAALTEAGYKSCFNVTGGFEGPHDEKGHRGRVDGWKAKDLPWAQN